MQLIEITDKKQLNDFVGSQPMSQFLQSWQWGEFQAKVSGGKVWRLAVLDNGELAASATIMAKELPMGKKYLYGARGPVGITNYPSRSRRAEADEFPSCANASEDKRITNELFKAIKELALREGAIFLRFDPPREMFRSARFGKFKEISRELAGRELVKTLDVQPSKTLVLDLTESEEELLKEMSQKTRYNIKLAEKKGVKILESGAERFEEFWQLLVSTGDRDEFNLHGRSYYQAMLKFGSNFVKLFFAEAKGKLLAGNLAVFFGDTATYLHGGSANEDRNVMAPYLLQWHSIKLAKAQGQKYYDFHGLDEIKWPGVTRFKKGFGGFEVNYPGTFDLVYDPGWYSIYKMVRKIRRTF